jgi:hypothetical protein
MRWFNAGSCSWASPMLAKTDGGPGMKQDPTTYVLELGLRAPGSHIVHDLGIHGTAAENRGGLQDATHSLSHIDHQRQYNDAACQLLGDDSC